jgi:hypothetical protein
MYHILIAIESCVKPKFLKHYYLFTNNIKTIHTFRENMMMCNCYISSTKNKLYCHHYHFHEKLSKIISIDNKNKNFMSNLIFKNNYRGSNFNELNDEDLDLIHKKCDITYYNTLNIDEIKTDVVYDCNTNNILCDIELFSIIKDLD